MKEIAPSPDEWKELLESAIAFQKVGCWEWMYDSDIFGVRNSETGETGYCCVMGNLGELFALGVYLGREGLEGYLRMQSGIIGEGDPEILRYQKCIMVSFEDRKDLNARDLKTIKESGIKFRGSKVWPQFRSYRPGYFPWHLTSDEARFLTLALRQSIDVALRFKENRKLLPRSADDLFLVRVPTKSEDGILWEDRLLKPEPKEDRPATDEAIDELRIARIRKSATGKAGIWETDFVMAPMSVRDDDRPYFPFLMMVVDHRSYMILHNDMSSPWEYKSALPEGFLKFLERIKVFPSELRASRKETFDLLRPITDSLGIKLTLTDDTEALDSACSALFGYFGGR